jgi:uncharacterized repeat protein (TIGR03803 family)
MKRFAKEFSFGIGLLCLNCSTRPAGCRRPKIKRAAAWLCAGIALCSAAEAQTFTLLYSFPTYARPGWYDRPLLLGQSLYAFGPGSHGSGSIFRVNTDGTGYTTIKDFPTTAYGTNSDGGGPMGGLIASGDTLYGTCNGGGLYGFGTIFSLKTNGAGFTVLKQFAGAPDGKDPYCELLMVSNVLYGTTAAGGSFGRGTVFQINPDGSGFSIIKSFAGPDGMLPLGPVTWSDGVLYGTTESGGAWTNGTVFSLLPDGSGFATLKDFDGQLTAAPRYSLVVSGGWIYGTTEGSYPSQGLVYRLSTDGTQFDVIKAFSPADPVTYTNVDGGGTQSGLVASGGALFGSTRGGGFYSSGVLFTLQMDGSGYTVLKHFPVMTNGGSGNYPNSEGAAPGRLALAGSTIYGLTKYGGSAGVGTLFSLNFAPRIQVASTGAGANGFSFDIIGYSNQVVSIQASAELAPPAWQPLATNTLGGAPLRVVDLDATNYAQRFYRVETQ